MKKNHSHTSSFSESGTQSEDETHYIEIKKIIINNVKFKWGLGIGDWGLGIGPNPQSPIPNPH